MPVRSRSSFSTASRGTAGKRAIRSSTRAVRSLTLRTLAAEPGREAGDPVGAVDANPRQGQEPLARRGEAGALDRRRREAGRPDGGQDPRVVPPRRVAEEVHGDVEAAPDPRARAGYLVPQVG